ncbi:hypothetical protein DXT90_18995 [Agrobacterium tumefaciens]|nr:hypothetical protein [Agrobacterium tumefaciens]
MPVTENLHPRKGPYAAAEMRGHQWQWVQGVFGSRFKAASATPALFKITRTAFLLCQPLNKTDTQAILGPPSNEQLDIFPT